jgi:BirA family biotin operon repressor/biotin-[acetyl-CoA-carboxylase] ligase
MQRFPIEIRVNRHGRNAELLAGSDHPDGDLAAVGYEDLGQHIGHSVSVLLDERVLARLAVETRFRHVRLLEVTDSTNRVAAALAAEGAPEGAVVVADVQTAGRGRLERTWEAEPGSSLLVSVLLRPTGLPVPRWHLVTAAAGLAAQSACSSVAGVEVAIKWPNDLLIGKGKVAGILAEASGSAVVLGMGLNVHGAPPGAVSLDEAAGRRVDRGALLVEWLTRLDRLLGRWEVVADQYRSRCSTVGQQVVVGRGGEGDELRGRAEAIDGQGRLLVRRPDGSLATVAAGDVAHVRPGPPGRDDR